MSWLDRKGRLVAIAEAKLGATVTVRGRVRRLGETATAPLSGRRCVAWSVRLLFARPFTGLGTRVTDPAFAEAWAGDFLVEDATGVARVRGARGWLVLAQDFVAEYDLRRAPPPPEVARYLAARGRWPLAGGWRVECREGALVEGATVDVTGVCGAEADPVPRNYRETTMRPVVEAPPGGYVRITNEPA